MIDLVLMVKVYSKFHSLQFDSFDSLFKSSEQPISRAINADNPALFDVTNILIRINVLLWHISKDLNEICSTRVIGHFSTILKPSNPFVGKYTKKKFR